MTDRSHLNAIELRLSHERVYRDSAKNDQERQWREHNIRMIERERDAECDFLGIERIVDEPAISMDDILAELGI